VHRFKAGNSHHKVKQTKP